jgi:hypothetical protein
MASVTLRNYTAVSTHENTRRTAMETVVQKKNSQSGIQVTHAIHDEGVKRGIFVFGMIDRLKAKGVLRGGDYELSSKASGDFNSLEADGFKPTFYEIEFTYAGIVVDVRRESLGLPPVDPCSHLKVLDILEAQGVIGLDSTATKYEVVGEPDHTNPEYAAFNTIVRAIAEEAGVEVPPRGGK